ncbi:MAG TPA: hypothetical protein VKB62_10675 [Streptosporangiaceae bacterium]|nr:hypothetical protein [Streptosporangiaceae bacterium]
MGSIAAGSEQAEGAGTGAGAEGQEGAAGSIRFHRAIRRRAAAGLLDAARAVAAAHRLAAVLACAILALAADAVPRAGVWMVAQAP